MTLEKLNQDLVKALKEKDIVTKEVLRSAIGNIKKAAIDKKIKEDIPESLVDEVLLKEQKTLWEMINTCPADRVDTLKDYRAQKEIIDKYAPKLIADEKEIEKLILQLCKETPKCLGNCQPMKCIMPRLKGKVDMKVASKVIKDYAEALQKNKT